MLAVDPYVRDKRRMKIKIIFHKLFRERRLVYLNNQTLCPGFHIGIGRSKPCLLLWILECREVIFLHPIPVCEVKGGCSATSSNLLFYGTT